MNLQQIGWKCPICGTVYSPSVTSCKKCSNKKIQENKTKYNHVLIENSERGIMND